MKRKAMHADKHQKARTKKNRKHYSVSRVKYISFYFSLQYLHLNFEVIHQCSIYFLDNEWSIYNTNRGKKDLYVSLDHQWDFDS
jgi:hypothetical protein